MDKLPIEEIIEIIIKIMKAIWQIIKQLFHHFGFTFIFVFNSFVSIGFKILPFCIIWLFGIHSISIYSTYDPMMGTFQGQKAALQMNQPKGLALLFASQAEAASKNQSQKKEEPAADRKKPINITSPDGSYNPNQQEKILKKGAQVWNNWRERNPGVLPYFKAADLHGAGLGETNLWGADLSNADMSEADLRRADLRKAILNKADLRDANLEGARLWKAHVYQANMQKANLQKADLAYANLNKADLREANLQLADLEGAGLEEANLEEANLKGTNLWGANLKKASLQKADLSEANLWGVNLNNTNMIKADLSGANLEKADLSGANLQEANLRTGKKFTVEQLCKAKTLYGTILKPSLMEQAQYKCPALLENPAISEKH